MRFRTCNATPPQLQRLPLACCSTEEGTRKLACALERSRTRAVMVAHPSLGSIGRPVLDTCMPGPDSQGGGRCSHTRPLSPSSASITHLPAPVLPPNPSPLALCLSSISDSSFLARERQLTQVAG